jgi:formylglycine-generating enzyme required for sulfatase activity
MGQTVVTQAQWNSLMGDNPSHFKGDSLPVETVSWDDALEFCQKLTDQERSAGRLPAGYTYTLPTEAQWEYACRAGTTGDSPSDRAFDAMAWYAANSHVTTHPVGTKQKGAKGLFDMHGNVFEWCLDWYANYPDQAVTDPTGPALVPAPSPASRGNAGGTYRINRGGSWITAARDCRAAFRGYDLPANKRSDLGFRLALAPSPGN